jgi:ArsR family transcriptional regulator
MLDHVEVARILDILGNRNRRRIIELLRQKPCFVTEISDRLVLSPKAVIEHLQLMEREEILTFRLDERRRKYYYISNDISVVVNLHRIEEGIPVSGDQNSRLKKSLGQLRKLVEARDELTERLSNTEKDIDIQIREIVQQGREVLDDDAGIDLIIALAHCNLTGDELSELTGQPVQDLAAGLAELREKQIVEQEGPTFRLCGINAE